MGRLYQAGGRPSVVPSARIKRLSGCQLRLFVSQVSHRLRGSELRDPELAVTIGHHEGPLRHLVQSGPRLLVSIQPLALLLNGR
jgi:hypothetical protein